MTIHYEVQIRNKRASRWAWLYRESSLSVAYSRLDEADARFVTESVEYRIVANAEGRMIRICQEGT